MEREARGRMILGLVFAAFAVSSPPVEAQGIPLDRDFHLFTMDFGEHRSALGNFQSVTSAKSASGQWAICGATWEDTPTSTTRQCAPQIMRRVGFRLEGERARINAGPFPHSANEVEAVKAGAKCVGTRTAWELSMLPPSSRSTKAPESSGIGKRGPLPRSGGRGRCQNWRRRCRQPR